MLSARAIANSIWAVTLSGKGSLPAAGQTVCALTRIGRDSNRKQRKSKWQASPRTGRRFRRGSRTSGGLEGSGHDSEARGLGSGGRSHETTEFGCRSREPPVESTCTLPWLPARALSI